jgi:hypothetical protein
LATAAEHAQIKGLSDFFRGHFVKAPDGAAAVCNGVFKAFDEIAYESLSCRIVWPPTILPEEMGK